MNTISMLKPQGFQLDDIFNSAYSKSISILYVSRTYDQISQQLYTFIEQTKDQLFAFIFHLSGNSQEKIKQTNRQTEMLQMTTLVLLWELLSYKRKATEVGLD